jgi:hypothetical protein
MFIFGKRPYDYYEKVNFGTSELVGIDVVVKVYLTFYESKAWDYVDYGSFIVHECVKQFPTETYGMAVVVELEDKDVLRKSREEKNKVATNMVLESKGFLKKKNEILAKIRAERGELPEYEMDTYIDEIEKEYHWKEYKNERYVGRYC